MSRLFTLEQANGTLPLVKKIVADIVRAYGPWRELVDQYELAAAGSHADAPDDRQLALEREVQKRAEEIDRFAAELAQVGVELKSFDTGLVDFPSEMNGRTVYLCWRLGEPSVQYWHEVDAGFSGRQAIGPVAVA